MRAHPSAVPTIQNQGSLFGEAISDLVSEGMPITEALTEILAFGPISLREAVHAARCIRAGFARIPYDSMRRDDNTPSTRGPGSWHLSSTCAVCSGPPHEGYSSGPPAQPSRF